MARRRGKDVMRIEVSNTGNMQSVISRKPTYRILLLVIGIAVCLFLVLYFSLTAPKSETAPRSEDGNAIQWHQMSSKWDTKKYTKSQMQQVFDSINISRLQNDILPNILIVRKPGTENITKVKNFIAKTLKDIGWAIEEHSFEESPPASYSKSPVKFTNVIATWNPNARRRLVLACHYDSKVTPEGFLGATDSAVPCAMLIEIAILLKDSLSGSPNDLTLQLLFLDGEEAFVEWTATDSLYGARNLAKKWESESWPKDENSNKNTLHSIDLFVLLDLLGEANPKFILKTGVDTPRHYEELTRIDEIINDNRLYFQKRRSYASVQDDHIPFLDRNVPILHIISLPFPKNWHLITDNGDNINFNTVHRLTKIITVFTVEYLHLD